MDNQVIYDLLKEVRDEQKEINNSMLSHTAKFSEHLVSDQKMADDINYLKDAMTKNNEILDKLTDTVIVHEARSTNLEKLVVGTEEKPGFEPRIVKLEEPEKAKEYLRKKYMKVAGVVSITLGIVAAVGKLFGWY